MKKLIAIGLALMSSYSFATEISVGLSNHTAELDYANDIADQAFAEFGYLHHEEDGDVLHLGAFGTGRSGMISGQVGGKLYWLDVDGPNGHGIALGGRVGYHPMEKLTVQGAAFYSPDVTSFKDIEDYNEYGARVIFELMDTATLFAGYRNVFVHVVDFGMVRIHEGAYAGVSVRF